MRGGSGLTECVRKCRKLLREVEQDSFIPPEKFAGETADVLAEIRKEQIYKLEKICKKLSTL